MHLTILHLRSRLNVAALLDGVFERSGSIGERCAQLCIN